MLCWPRTAYFWFVARKSFRAKKRRENDAGEATPPPPLRASSAGVYRSMFTKFLRWIEKRQLGLFDVTNDVLMAFLEQGAGKSLIKLRYLRMLERTFMHLEVRPNPAQHASFAIFQSGDRARVGRDEEKATLSDPEQAAFMRALPEPINWKRRRDRAVQALMLGAGLKVSETVGLYIENVGVKDGVVARITN